MNDLHQKPIIYLSKTHENNFVQEWYDLADPDHFWMQWRFKAFLNQIKQKQLPLKKYLRGLDIGCGHGMVLKEMEAHTEWTIDGADLNIKGLSKMPSIRGECYFYNILERNNTLREKYDFLVLFDVLEHIENTKDFLDACLFHLKHKGHLFINVPALMSLYGPYDRVVGHYRRYNKNTLLSEFKGFNIAMLDMRYWGVLLIPLLVTRNFLARPNQSKKAIIDKGFNPPNKFIHSFLKLLMQIETTLLPKPIRGTSVMAVIQKN